MGGRTPGSSSLYLLCLAVLQSTGTVCWSSFYLLLSSWRLQEPVHSRRGWYLLHVRRSVGERVLCRQQDIGIFLHRIPCSGWWRCQTWCLAIRGQNAGSAGPAGTPVCDTPAQPASPSCPFLLERVPPDPPLCPTAGTAGVVRGCSVAAAEAQVDQLLQHTDDSACHGLLKLPGDSNVQPG